MVNLSSKEKDTFFHLFPNLLLYFQNDWTTGKDLIFNKMP